MNGTVSKSQLTARIVVCVVALVLIVGIVIAAVALSTLGVPGDMLPKDEILSGLENVSDSHTYVADALIEIGIGNFYARKMRIVENLFSANYVGELPSVKEMATAITEKFLAEHYDKLDLTDEEAVTTALIKLYTDATGDDYAVYRTPDEYEMYQTDLSGEFVGIGVSIMVQYDAGLIESIQVSRTLTGSSALEVGIMSGDFIIAVDGKPTTGMDELELNSSITGTPGSTVNITVLRGENEIITFPCERRRLVEYSVEYEVLDGNIGYIMISSFKDNTPEQFATALGHMNTVGVDGIIFDLRNNLGGLLTSVLDVLNMLVPSGTPLVSFTTAGDETTVYKSSGGTALDVPAVVLCNGLTASAGELFTSAMRDYNEEGILDAVIVGTQTFGKGVMQNTYPVGADGATLTLTMAYYNSPKGENYDGVGITPNEVIENQNPSYDWIPVAREKLEELIRAAAPGIAA